MNERVPGPGVATTPREVEKPNPETVDEATTIPEQCSGNNPEKITPTPRPKKAKKPKLDTTIAHRAAEAAANIFGVCHPTSKKPSGKS